MERWNNRLVLEWLCFSEAHVNERIAITSVVKIGSAPRSNGSTSGEHKQSGSRGNIAGHVVFIINAQHGHFRYGNRREQQAVLVDEIKIVESNELTTVRAYEVGDNVC